MIKHYSLNFEMLKAHAFEQPLTTNDNDQAWNIWFDTLCLLVEKTKQDKQAITIIDTILNTISNHR